MCWDTGAASNAGALLGGFSLESRSLPIGVLGLGKSKVPDKSNKLLRAITLECGKKVEYLSAGDV